MGTWLRWTANKDTRIIGCAHRSPLDDCDQVRVDLRDGALLREAVDRIRPSLVIHAAYALDRESIVAATANVVEAATSVGAGVLFISTDAVFDGDGAVTAEASVPRPVWDYGRWKLEAEALVSEASCAAAIARLPLVVSLDPPDAAVTRMTEAAARGDSTEWYVDEIRQPAMAGDIAEGLWRIAALPPDDRQGVWHLPGPERLDRHAIAHRYVSALGLDPNTLTAGATPPSASRPRNICMAAERAQTKIGWSPSSILKVWTAMSTQGE